MTPHQKHDTNKLLNYTRWPNTKRSKQWGDLFAKVGCLMPSLFSPSLSFLLWGPHPLNLASGMGALWALPSKSILIHERHLCWWAPTWSNWWRPQPKSPFLHFLDLWFSSLTTNLWRVLERYWVAGTIIIITACLRYCVDDRELLLLCC